MKKKNIHLSNILILLMMFPYLSGCWDRTSIDERAYVIAMGLDKSEEENILEITYLIENPEYSKQEGASNEPPKEIISFQTNDLIASKNMANTVIAKEVTYSLLSVLIVSEDLAKDPRFIRMIYDTTKDREIKRSIPFIVTKEKASDFILNNNPKLETKVHKYFELILKFGADAGLIPDSKLHGYFRITEADAELFLATYGTTKSNKQQKGYEENQFIAGNIPMEGNTNLTQLAGSAVFKEGKMIGKLTAEETRLAVILNDTLNMESILTTYPDPFNEKYRITARVMKKEKNKVKMDLKKDVPTIDVTVPLYMEILSDHSMVNYAHHAKKRAELKTFLEQYLSGKMNELVKKTQEEFKGEPFGWSLNARKKFATIPEYKKYDWMKTYPNMNVNVNVTIRFGDFGRQAEIPNLKKVRG